MTAEHRYISNVLHSHWSEYRSLKSGMDSFSARPIEDYDEKRTAILTNLVTMNPSASVAELEKMADASAAVEHKHQFSDAFSDRTLKLFVSVVFMSQALCEALINQILILRFHDEGISETYEVWERAKFEEKWRLAPKSFISGYNFDKGGALYCTLKELVAQRNVYTHYKPMVEIDGKIIYGKEPKRRSFKELVSWIRRFISLPYDLAVLSSVLMNEPSYQILLNRGDIEMAEEHEQELERLFKLAENLTSDPSVKI